MATSNVSFGSQATLFELTCQFECSFNCSHVMALGSVDFEESVLNHPAVKRTWQSKETTSVKYVIEFSS